MPPKKNSGKNTANQGKKPDGKRKTAPSAPRRLLAEQKKATASKQTLQDEEQENAGIDLAEAVASIPTSLQQLLLNVFKTALLPETATASTTGEKDLHTQIQTLKAHLYNRDFASAFADASPELLRAYALRWSASRCLAYVGIFKAVVTSLLAPAQENSDDSRRSGKDDLHILCMGGGAGAEIVALAGVWRALLEEQHASQTENSVEDNLEQLSLAADSTFSSPLPNLSITAVDIAEWSSVVDCLGKTIHSSTVPGQQKSYPSPLLTNPSQMDVSFRHLDVLSLSEHELSSILSPQTALVSLMFTLNELFSTSMPKTTQLLLRITDQTGPGTILLIVDSPGSYSTLSLGGGGGGDATANQRQYPMKFLLEHALLTVAEGKWEKLLSQDSTWFRRDASKLSYSVNLEGGDGLVKLEDMRYQIHVYRRLSTRKR